MAKRWRTLHQRRKRKLKHATELPFRWFDEDGYPFDDNDSDFDGDSNCYWCGGDGWVDGEEDDPLWYAPGELARCSSCGGTGRAKDMTIW